MRLSQELRERTKKDASAVFRGPQLESRRRETVEHPAIFTSRLVMLCKAEKSEVRNPEMFSVRRNEPSLWSGKMLRESRCFCGGHSPLVFRLARQSGWRYSLQSRADRN